MEKLAMVIYFIVATIYAVSALPITTTNPTIESTEPPSPPQSTSEYVQDIVCVVESTKQSLSNLQYVEVQPCFSTELLSCSPETSTNLTVQAAIVWGYAQYVIQSEILENSSNSSELFGILSAINETLSSLHNEVNDSSAPVVVLPTIPTCSDDYNFHYNCSIHLLNSSLHHFLSLLLHNLPECSFCSRVSEGEEIEIKSLYQFFRGSLFDQLLPLQCRIPFYFGQYRIPSECSDDTYTLQNRLKDLTQWMNDTLLQMNNTLPQLEYLVNQMSSVILPATDRALAGLKSRERCMGEPTPCTAPDLQLELVEMAASQFALPECFPEPHRLQSAIIVQLFDLTRQTFNTLFEHFSFKEIITA